MAKPCLFEFNTCKKDMVLMPCLFVCSQKEDFMKIFNYVYDLVQNYNKPCAFLSDICCTNNVTIFLEEKNLPGFQKILKNKGYRQGYLDNNQNLNYTDKKEIQRLKAYTGEIVPWIKLVENIPIAINIKINLRHLFSTKEDDLIKNFLENALTYNYGGNLYRVLHPVDYFIYILFFSDENMDRQRQNVVTFINEFYCKDFLDDLRERVEFLFKENDYEKDN